MFQHLCIFYRTLLETFIIIISIFSYQDLIDKFIFKFSFWKKLPYRWICQNEKNFMTQYDSRVCSDCQQMPPYLSPNCSNGFLWFRWPVSSPRSTLTAYKSMSEQLKRHQWQFFLFDMYSFIGTTMPAWPQLPKSLFRFQGKVSH